MQEEQRPYKRYLKVRYEGKILILLLSNDTYKYSRKGHLSLSKFIKICLLWKIFGFSFSQVSGYG